LFPFKLRNDETLLAILKKSFLSRAIEALDQKIEKIEFGQPLDTNDAIELMLTPFVTTKIDEFMYHYFDWTGKDQERTTEPVDGEGLGLALAKEMLVAAGSRLDVKSQNGETSFIIKIPQALVAEVATAEDFPLDKALTIRETAYPNATLNGQGSVKAHIMDVNFPVHLVAVNRPEINGEPFTKEERARFESGEGVIVNPPAGFITRENIQTVKQSIYDRSSGFIKFRMIVTLKDGRVFFLEYSGANSTQVRGATEAMLPTLDALGSPGAIAQISRGNHAELQGYFTLHPNTEGGWNFSGASDERRQRKTYKVLIEYKDGRRELAVLRIVEDPLTKKIREVRTFPKNESRSERLLDPTDVSFVMASYAVLWGDLREYYTYTSDLRHLFRFPFIDDFAMFSDQLHLSPEKTDAAFQGKPSDFILKNPLGKPLEVSRVWDALNQAGYKRKLTKAQVFQPGDFCFTPEGIYIALLSARYPVNGMAVSEDGKRISFVNVSGLSGRVGANYWNLGAWLEKTLGWKPAAFFIFDNGMDPTWRIKKGDQMVETSVKGRERVGAALNIIPMVPSGDKPGVAGVKPFHNSGPVSNSREIKLDESVGHFARILTNLSEGKLDQSILDLQGVIKLNATQSFDKPMIDYSFVQDWDTLIQNPEFRKRLQEKLIGRFDKRKIKNMDLLMMVLKAIGLPDQDRSALLAGSPIAQPHVFVLKGQENSAVVVAAVMKSGLQHPVSFVVDREHVDYYDSIAKSLNKIGGRIQVTAYTEAQSAGLDDQFNFNPNQFNVSLLVHSASVNDVVFILSNGIKYTGVDRNVVLLQALLPMAEQQNLANLDRILRQILIAA
jgi:hypothetical protein